ncbi:MAG: DUF1571 domain-containing protein [Planctomycetaceae bacterium]|jgi:hypothetical protein|nr:DUF1571 domain-containing protein [Planctomycetaceae bacterium]
MTKISHLLHHFYLGGVAVCVSAAAALPVSAQESASDTARVASAARQVSAAATEHPLVPVIRWAEAGRPKIEAIRDYTAIMQKQENLGGEVQEAQVMEIKVRHNPFSVYLKFRYPKKMNGQEAIWVPSQNNGKLIAHGVGLEKSFGTQFIDPEGFIAMRGCKYSIKEMGLLNLVDKLLEVGKKDSKYGECDVTYTEDVKVDGRVCTLIQVTHPVQRSNFIFYIARIYVDKETNIPIRYESYDWPAKQGETPKLLEAYTYLKLNLNTGLTDADFDYKNPKYDYAK